MSFTQGPYLDYENNVQRINETLMNIWKLANSIYVDVIFTIINAWFWIKDGIVNKTGF